MGYFPGENVIMLLEEDGVNLEEILVEFDAAISKNQDVAKMQQELIDKDNAEAAERKKAQQTAISAVKAAAKLARKARKAAKLTEKAEVIWCVFQFI